MLRRQIENAFWAVAEQGTFSIAGFVTNVLLARTLSAADYGTFAMSYAVYLALLQLQTAFFGDPVLVLAAGKYRDRSAAYLSRLLRAYWLVWPAMALIMIAVAHAPLAADPGATRVFTAMALAAPCLNFIHMMRRVDYASSSTKSAAMGALVYAVCVVAGIELLRRAGLLTAVSAYAVLASSSLAVGAAWWRMRKPQPDASNVPLSSSDVVREHWGYARWGALATLMAWVPLNSWYLTMPVVAPGLGVAASGLLRALFNLVQPVLQANNAVAAALIPTFAQGAAARHLERPLRWTLLALAPPLLYCVALIAVGPWLMPMLYGEAYEVGRGVLLAFGLVPALHALLVMMRGYCLARGRPELVLQSASLAALASLGVGIPLCRAYGLTGAGAGMLAGFIAQSLWLASRLRTLR